MSHLSRQEIPKKWPIERKGSTYIVRPRFDTENGIPLLIALRNMFNLAQTRKEAKKIIREVVANYLGHALSQKDQEDLLIKALTDAKHQHKF